MTYRTTVALFVIVCLLAAALWMMQRTVESTDRRLATAERILNLDLMHVDTLSVQNDGVDMDLVRRGAAWWIVRPVEARADEAQIGRLLSASEALVGTETITREQREHRGISLGDYGLDIPSTSVTYRTPRGAQRLLIGHTARLGGQTYVRIDGASDVILADGNLAEALPASIEVMRDRALMQGQPTRVMRLEIERPGGGFVQLLRSSSGWIVQQPIRDPASPAVITALLDDLYAARIERFVWDPPSGASPVAPDALPVVDSPTLPVESYGLAIDTTPARVRVWEAGDDVGRELFFGKPVDAEGQDVYAMFADRGSVFTLKANLLARFQVSVDSLRSRTLMPLDPNRIRYLAVQCGDRKLTLGYTDKGGWSILEPIQWAADSETVSDVLRALTAARIQSFGDAPVTHSPDNGDDAKALHIIIDTVYPPPAPGSTSGGVPGTSSGELCKGRCELVAVDTGTNELMDVQISGRAGHFTTRSTDLKFLREATVRPLAFFERTVLAVAPDQIHRITVHNGSKDQALERNAEGTWRALQPSNGVVNAQGLSQRLFDVSNLRAARVAEHNPKQLAPYGLDQTQTSLTIGLTGGEAIQKIILIGAPTDASGRYAMIQGQDVVFVLDQVVAESLLSDLVTQPTQDAL